jgi:hypothetical protein
MPRVTLNIASGFNRDESLAIAATDCVNLYPHLPSGQTTTQGSVIGCAGINEICFTQENAFNRGGIVFADKAYVVNGTKLWRIDFTTDLNGVRTYSAVNVSGAESIDGTARVAMASNGEQISIVAPDVATQFNMWIYSVGGGLVQVSDADFDGPVLDVDYVDGYFVYPKANSNKWFISDLRDGTGFNALDFTSAESDPDPLVAMAPLNGLLYAFGQKTFEPYQNTGNADFPFERINSGIQQKGCLSAESIVEVNGTLMWIGSGENERPSVLVTNGGMPQRVSNPAVENYIYQGGIEPLRKSYAMRWHERGHTFISFTVPSVCTVVYDTSTQTWHRRESLDRFLNPQPWRVTTILDSYSVKVVGDELSGKIGLMDESIFYEYGEEMRRYVTPPAIDNGGRPFSIYQVELVAESGTAPQNGQGSNPRVGLSVSTDGGRTYKPKIYRGMGQIGQYLRPISWPTLGRFQRSVCFRLDISEPIKVVFVKLEAEIGS